MAKHKLWPEIITIGIFTFLFCEVSANTFYYTKLKVTSLDYSEQLTNRTSPEFTTTANTFESLIYSSLTLNDTSTILTNETVLKITVQHFSPGTEVTALIEVTDDTQVKTTLSTTLTTIDQNGKLGQETLQANSMNIVNKQAECNDGFVMDFTSVDCKACPKGTYQEPGLRGQCDPCLLKDTSTLNEGSIGSINCLALCTVDLNYCNGGICRYNVITGASCECPYSFGFNVGGKRCEKLITFYVGFNITSKNYIDQHKNKSSMVYKNTSVLAEKLITDALVASNNALLTRDKIEQVVLLTVEPGLGVFTTIEVINASGIDTAVNTAMVTAMQNGMLGSETVDSGSLTIINNINRCPVGHVMDFTKKSCSPCPIGTYEPVKVPRGQCESCPPGKNTTIPGLSGDIACTPICAIKFDYCMNGASCIYITEGEDTGQKCICPYDYTGRRCEKVLTIVDSVFPEYGPEAGGTGITISGVHFDTSRGLRVLIGDSECTGVTGNETTIECVTGQFNKTAYSFGQKMNMTVSYTSPPEVAPLATRKFTYRRNPMIEEIKPLGTFISGGLLLTVLGRHMDGVYEPKLMTKLRYSNGSNITITTNCKVENWFTLLCPTPKIGNSGLTRTKRSAALSRHVRQLPSISQFKVGFQLDGLMKYQDLSGALVPYATIKVYPDPDVEFFDPLIHGFHKETEPKLTIQGKNFNIDSGLAGFYKIMIGDEECSNLEIKSTTLRCDVPDKPSNNSNYKIKVKIGDLVFNPGYVKYRPAPWNNDIVKYAIIGAAIGTAALIVTVVSCWILISVGRFMRAGPKGKDSHNASLVTDNYSESDAQSIIPNPMANYYSEELPRFSSARFYTNSSRHRPFDEPTGSTNNSQNFAY